MLLSGAPPYRCHHQHGTFTDVRFRDADSMSMHHHTTQDSISTACSQLGRPRRPPRPVRRHHPKSYRARSFAKRQAHRTTTGFCLSVVIVCRRDVISVGPGFVGERLVKAISATFRNRGTTIEAEPIGLTQAYCDDPARAIQWRAFVRRSRFSEESGELARLVTEIRQFALPMLSAIAAGSPFKALWKPGGPWG